MKHLACTLLAVSACGSDPVSYSAPVGINLKVKSGDVANNAITDQKGITTESGNPYGAFVNDATAKLAGNPARIEIDGLTLSLGGQSTGVASLEQIFTGDVDIALVMNDTNNTYDAGHVMNPTGVGPVDVDISFAGDQLAPADFAKMLTGSFQVAIRGPAAATFSTKGADANLQATFTFAAFE